MRYLLIALGCLAILLSPPSWAWGPAVTTEHVRAELVAWTPDGIQGGKQFWLGLAIRHKPGWHTYWRNPGDSGLPITLDWSLPPELRAGDIEWPLAKAFPIGPMTNYGYDGDLLLPVPMLATATPNGQQVEVRLKAEWLVCEKICIPEEGAFSLSLPTATPLTRRRAAFETALAAVPKPDGAVRASARFAPPLQLRLAVAGLPPHYGSGPLRLMVEDAGVVEHAAPVKAMPSPDGLQLLVPLSPQRSASPGRMHAVLVDEDDHASVRLSFPVQGGWNPAPAAPPPVQSAGLLLALGLAFVGGAVLNLMPCVFPVLSLKVLGFSQHAGDRSRIVRGGFAYTAGVVLSFLALAAALLLLRQGGEQLGWGFQLQSPLVIAALALLFAVIGLNLAGLFEFGNLLPSRLAAMRARSPVADDFLTGVLAVAVASPCTAPFMGVAVGAAIFMPAPQALMVFAAIGLGMATPYLAAALVPAVAAALPRPGMWMVRFKQLMAVPMFATVAWLLWVLAQQLSIVAPGRHDPASAWQPWSEQAVHQARQQGRPVFVDFTAAWCITCQVNKRLVLNDEQAMQAFAARRAVLLRADWTARDPAISAELARLGRNGVPVYALYSPASATPLLLPELLSVAEVKKALASLPGP